jgi:hypothetical protein
VCPLGTAGGMKRALLMFIGLIAAALAALVGGGLWYLTPNKYEWNQRITVEVETPDGMKSDSTVQHILWEGGGPAYPGQDGPSSSSKVTGEAVVVDLGGGKYLFALLSGTHGLKGTADTIASFAFWGADKAAGTAEGLKYLASLKAGTQTELEPSNYPLLVTFADVHDPSTVQKVDPGDLAGSFGFGFALKGMKIEISAENARSPRLVTLLKWVGENTEAALLTNLRPTDFSFAAKRRHGEFLRR